MRACVCVRVRVCACVYLDTLYLQMHQYKLGSAWIKCVSFNQLKYDTQADTSIQRNGISTNYIYPERLDFL